MWRQADKYHVPRLAFVNKMDAIGADFERCLQAIRDRLAGNPVAVTIPLGSGSGRDGLAFRGVIDLIDFRALFFNPEDKGKSVRSEPIPDDQLARARAWRERLLDARAANDTEDRLLSAYVGGEISPELLRRVLREQTLRRQVQPALCGSGRAHIGIQPVLDAVCSYLPSPADRPPVEGRHPRTGQAEQRGPDAQEPFCGLVFKVVANQHGDLFYVRLYSGSLRPDTRVYNPARCTEGRAGKLYHVRADPQNREEIPQGFAGDIVVLTGLDGAATGDTLCPHDRPLLLEPVRFAEPVLSRTIEPHSQADRDRLIAVLGLLAREDPTFTWRADPQQGQLLMSGMGQLHLEVKRRRLEEHGLRVRVYTPRVSYRWALRRPVSAVGEHLRERGAAGGFARVVVEFAPCAAGEATAMRCRLKGGTLLPAFVAATEGGIWSALQSGPLGYAVQVCSATIVGGEMDEHSSEAAFAAAGAAAVEQALKGNVVLLEPVMRVEVTVPEEHYGAVSADLVARRGQIKEVRAHALYRVIEATAPLEGMLDYAERLRSLSRGRASAILEPQGYGEAPDEVLARQRWRCSVA